MPLFRATFKINRKRKKGEDEMNSGNMFQCHSYFGSNAVIFVSVSQNRTDGVLFPCRSCHVFSSGPRTQHVKVCYVCEAIHVVMHGI